MKSKKELFFIFCIFLSSAIFVFDLFLHHGLPQTFDNLAHATSITQFFLALKDGDFPVRWSDGIGNYGLPLPIVAHQVPNYLGAFLMYFFSDPEIVLKILYFLSIFLSGFFFYLFLRYYFLPLYAFSGTFFYIFSSYKIFNTYVRGALPELFSAIWVPLILLGILLFLKEKKFKGLLLITISVALLALTHPMMLLIYSFLYLPFLFWMLLLTRERKNNFLGLLLQRRTIACVAGIILGFFIAGYYLIPLVLEIKYFYLSNSQPFTPGNYLTLDSFFRLQWPYFTDKDIVTRGHIINVGILETLVFIMGVVLLFQSVKDKKNIDQVGILFFAVLNGLVVIILMLPWVESIFSSVRILGSIQFQWRFLSAFNFFTPIILAYTLTRLKKSFFTIFVIFITAFFSFPQLYGKNYLQIDKRIYFFTPINVHSVLMNPIWTGKTEDYPLKKQKAEIIEGIGKIEESKEWNSQRTYFIDAQTPLRMVDYTFYFPGWNVYVDGKKTSIEFQDPAYRGVITYHIPYGEHLIHVKFENTKIRLLGNSFSLLGIGLFIFITFYRKILKTFLKVG